MPIKKGNLSIQALYKGTSKIDSVYKGTNLVFSGFPKEYQKVEYIESSGTQWIDTNYVVGTNIDLVAKAKINCASVQTADYPRVFGVRKNDPDRAFMLGQARGWYGMLTSNRTQPIVLNDNATHIIKIDKRGLEIDNNLYAMEEVASSILNIAYNLVIFAENEQGSIKNISNLKMFWFKLYSETTKIRDFVPCYRKADGVGGLYDLVTKTFFTNQGTGVFAYPRANGVLEIKGSGTLTAAKVSEAIASVSNKSEITKIVVDTSFDLESVCVVLSDYSFSSLPNLNGNFYYGTHTCRGVDFATDSEETISLSAWLDPNCPYALGDTRSVVYNNKTYTLRICDDGSRYELTNYSGKYNKFVVEFVEIVEYNQVNTTRTNDGGFALSYMKNTLLPNIYNNLPSKLKSIIKQVSVASANGGSNATGLSYSDNYLFEPNNYEIYGVVGSSNSLEETTQYGLYQLNNTNAFRVKNFTGEPYPRWTLRSPIAGDNEKFISVNNDGSPISVPANFQTGIAPFLCI